jgi:diguanylate cyclase (GGDEF)-like protein
MKHFEEAAAIIAEAMARFPGETWPLAEAAWIARARGDAEEAARLAVDLRGRFPDNSAGYQIGSVAAREMKHFEEAAAIIAEAMARFPGEAWPLAEAAWTAASGRDTDEAIRMAADMRSRFPNNPAGYHAGWFAAAWSWRLDEAATIIAEARTRFSDEAWLAELATWNASARDFLALAETEWSRFQNHAQPLATLLIDIDSLHLVKAKHGYDGGAEVAKLVANILQAHKRASDIYRHVGPDEFAFVLHEQAADNVFTTAERLRQLVANHVVTVKGQHEQVTISIGASTSRADMSGVDELLTETRIALQEAKRLGRNRVCLFGRC